MKLFISTLLVLILVGCSESEEIFVEQEGVYSDSYSFIFNGCETGQHTFKSDDLGELQFLVCEALVDHDLNEFCAYGLREDKFYEDSCDEILERDF